MSCQDLWEKVQAGGHVCFHTPYQGRYHLWPCSAVVPNRPYNSHPYGIYGILLCMRDTAFTLCCATLSDIRVPVNNAHALRNGCTDDNRRRLYGLPDIYLKQLVHTVP